MIWKSTSGNSAMAARRSLPAMAEQEGNCLIRSGGVDKTTHMVSV